MNPDIITEISGVELENDNENTVGPALQLEEESIKDIAQRTEDARKNFDHGNNFQNTHYHIKGMYSFI